MLNKSDITPAQNSLIDRIYESDCTLAVCGMGFGKSVSTLTAISELLADGVVKKVLIVAPLKVVKEVWAREHLNWVHVKHLRVGLAVGSVDKRKQALDGDFDIVAINFENLAWFCDTYKDNHDFDGLVLDELTKLKDNGSKAVKKLRYRTHAFKWHVGLTGTVVHEGFEGLFSQVLCLDGGASLGTSKQRFLLKHFYPLDYEQRRWGLRQGEEKVLLKRLEHLLFIGEDYTDELPALIESHSFFNLGLEAMTSYDKFKRDNVYTCADGLQIVADNSAVLSGKLEQFSSGFLYRDDLAVSEHIHWARLDAMDVYLGNTENKDENILIFYNFTEDKNRILARLGRDAVELSPESLALWNKGKVKYLIAHSKSAGHGINAQFGGARVLWYSPIWSNDVYKQANARVWRRGQTRDVIATTLVARDTVNELTVQRIEDKGAYDVAFKRHLSK